MEQKALKHVVKQARTIDHQQNVFMEETRKINNYEIQRKKILKQKEEAVRKRKQEILEEQLLKDLSRHRNGKFKDPSLSIESDPFSSHSINNNAGA